MMLAPTILLVDEDQNAVQSLASSVRLCHPDWTVEMAVGGDAALRVVREREVDVLVTEILMPERDGFEVIESVRRDHPEVKIVALSGQRRQDTRYLLNIARHLGADATLEKPFEAQKLLDLIRSLLGAGTGT